MDTTYLDTIQATNLLTLEEYIYVYPRLMFEYTKLGADCNEMFFIEEQIEQHFIHIDGCKNAKNRISNDYDYKKYGTFEDWVKTVRSFDIRIVSLKAIIKYLETKKSELEAPQPPTPPEDNSSEEKQENQFAKNIPLQFTIEHFSKLKTKNKKGNVFLTDEKFDKFIKCAFLNEKIIEKQKIDFERGESGKVIRVFYDYFDLACKDYGQKNSKDPFINLVFKCFDNWEPTEIKSFFKPNKTKDIL